MKNSRALRGTFTALVTPLNKNGSLDLGALDALVDWQIEQGVEGLVPCGTTGEGATLSGVERAEVITRVVRRTADRAVVIAGAGSNNTAEAVEHQKRAADTGATYALVVTPYYNKPTPNGLLAHYEALLQAADIPIVVYNVPSRTGSDLKPETVARLAALDGIVGIKEATGDLDRVMAIREKTKPGFALLSGDDPTACPFVWLGGDGVISVASNPAPKAMGDMIRAALDGQVQSAREQHAALRPLFAAMALEVNPLPVKTAMAIQGRVQEAFRLPLCPMESQNRQRLVEVLSKGGWATGR